MNTSPIVKILLVGPYPPPYGGVSVQVYELHKHLRQRGYQCEVLNIGESRKMRSSEYVCTSSYGIFAWLLVRYSYRGYLIHLLTNGHNTKSWLSAFTCMLAGTLQLGRTVLALGSGNTPLFIAQAGFLTKLLVRATLRLAGAVVCRNEAMADALRAQGAGRGKVAAIPGFVAVESMKPGPPPVACQVFRDTHSPLIGMMASVEPEYGTELLLGACWLLKTEYPQVGLVLIGIEAAELKRWEDSEGLESHLLCTGFLAHDVTLGVMKLLDAFVRPTYFDGDANSVREALCLGIPVVASATDYRPEGTVTFPIGDAAKCAEAIRSVLCRPQLSCMPRVSHSDSLATVEELYRRVHSGRPISDLGTTHISHCDEFAGDSAVVGRASVSHRPRESPHH